MKSNETLTLPLKFWIVALIALINSVGFTLIIPILYPYAKAFGLSDFEASLLTTVYAASQFIATPILGRLSDCWGRKPLLVISLIGTVLANIVASLTPFAWLLFAARILDGLTLLFRIVTLLTSLLLATNLVACSPSPVAEFSIAGGVYQQKSPSADGIGKVYLGREIAKVMGHEAAYWLERSSRKWEEQPDQAIDALDLQPTDVVADVGAGTGYFSFRISPLVPEGKVLAVDLQPEMLELINQVIEQDNIVNVETIQGSWTNPNLPPESVDLALMVDAYHEFDHPREIMQRLVAALKPGGRVVLAEYRGENPLIPIKRLHKMSQRQVKREMAAVGLVWRKTEDFLPLQHLMFFEKVDGRQ